jgi:hypothetical protein
MSKGQLPSSQRRLAEHKARENAEFQRIFGVTRHEGEVVMDMETIYGFASMDENDEEWYYTTGSFPYLYGLQNGLISDSSEDEEAFFNFALFILGKEGTDEESAPIAVLDQITVPANLAPIIGAKGARILRDLSVLENPKVEPIDFGAY